MSEPTYRTITDLQQALQDGDVKPEELTGFNCKHELFINDQQGKTIFSAYYGTNNACADICALLGIQVEIV